MNRVALFDHIRKEYFIHGKSARQIARQQNIHRTIVKQAITNAIPPVRKATIQTSKKLTDEIKKFIEECLQYDLNAPKKQRHTAHKIYMRLVEEYNFTGA